MMEGTAMQHIEVLHAGSHQLAEGPHWSSIDQRLHWVDITNGIVFSINADGTDCRSIDVHELVGAVVPCRAGGLLVALQSGIYTIDSQGERTLVAHPEHDRPGNRYNDGKCDSLGRFWVGSLALNGEPGAGRLWRIDPDGHCTLIEQHLDVPNGLGWSPDEQRFYHTDSGRATIYQYDMDMPSGALGKRRVFASNADGDGVPDGLTVDTEGSIWSAQWDGGCLIRYDADGRIAQRIRIDVPRPTSCTIGGPDHRTLYITSARVGLASEVLESAPCSGHILSMDQSVPGLPDHPFG